MNKTPCRHCFENGRGEQRYCSQRKVYDAQITFNRRMRALLAHEPNLSVPDAPDYADHWATGPIGAGQRINQLPGAAAWVRQTYSLLAQDGATYRRLRIALDRAAVTTLEPAAAPARRQSRKAA